MDKYKENLSHFRISRGTLVFFTILTVLVAAPFLRKMEFGAGIDPILKYSDEAILILFFGYAIEGAKVLLKNKYGMPFFVFFSLYIFSGVLSGILRNTSFLQMAYQGVLELKYPIVLSLVVGIGSLRFKASTFMVAGKVILTLSIPLIIWQFISPSSYDAFFPMGGHHGIFLLPSGVAIPRGAGLFWFQGSLAIFSGVLTIFFFFFWCNTKRIFFGLWSVVAFVVLLSTLQRLEILLTLFGIFSSLVLFSRGKKKIEILTLGILLSIGLAVVLLPIFLQAFYQLGLNDIETSKAARVVFYIKSFHLAKVFFPLGSGIGTFGGHAAEVFDSSLYQSLGFNNFWWYQTGKFMTDNFWPHILGESGVLGLIFYISSNWLLFAMVLSRRQLVIFSNDESKILHQIAMSALILVTGDLLTSPTFLTTDSLFFGLCALGIVIGAKKTPMMESKLSAPT